MITNILLVIAGFFIVLLIVSLFAAPIIGIRNAIHEEELRKRRAEQYKLRKQKHEEWERKNREREEQARKDRERYEEWRRNLFKTEVKPEPIVVKVEIPTELDNIKTGHDFEHYCSNLLSKNGFSKADVTRGSGDHGVDIIAEKEGIKYAIQCKYYNNPVGYNAVKEVYTGKDLYKAHVGVVMTNSTFTQQATKDAKQLGILLWDKRKLASFSKESGNGK